MLVPRGCQGCGIQAVQLFLVQQLPVVLSVGSQEDRLPCDAARVQNRAGWVACSCRGSLISWQFLWESQANMNADAREIIPLAVAAQTIPAAVLTL